jgi:hypothetical protein
MQGTADFHHHVANPDFPQADGLFEHAAAFDAAVDMFDAHAPPRDLPIRRFLRPRQRVPAGLLRGLDDVHPGEREGLKAQVLQELTPHGQRIRRRVGNPLVMHTARMRLTEEQNAHGSIDQQEVFQHVPLFLAAITRFLFSRILRAREGSLGAIMTKRGGAGGGAVWTSSAGDASSGREAPSISRRARKAST